MNRLFIYLLGVAFGFIVNHLYFKDQSQSIVDAYRVSVRGYYEGQVEKVFYPEHLESSLVRLSEDDKISYQDIVLFDVLYDGVVSEIWTEYLSDKYNMIWYAYLDNPSVGQPLHIKIWYDKSRDDLVEELIAGFKKKK